LGWATRLGRVLGLDSVECPGRMVQLRWMAQWGRLKASIALAWLGLMTWPGRMARRRVVRLAGSDQQGLVGWQERLAGPPRLSRVVSPGLTMTGQSGQTSLLAMPPSAMPPPSMAELGGPPISAPSILVVWLAGEPSPDRATHLLSLARMVRWARYACLRLLVRSDLLVRPDVMAQPPPTPLA
jgi:hypothetical protein